MSTTTLELPGARSLALVATAAHQSIPLWTVAVLGLGGVLTVAWVAFLGWSAFSLVAEVASWVTS